MEYQCHGSKAVVAALIAALVAQPGMRAAEPGEFTRRALANGRIDLTQAEGLAELLEAESEAQRDQRAAPRRGRACGARSSAGAARCSTCRPRPKWRSIMPTRRMARRAFDPSARLAALVAEIDALLAAPRVERLRDGVRVVVAGPPNAGKSSLVNALAGEARAIVTAIPGTTRDLVEVPLSLGGVPLTLVDTAGLRESDDEVERIGIGLAEREIERADLLLWLGDARRRCPTHPRCLARSPARPISATERTGHRVSAVDRRGLGRAQGLDRRPGAGHHSVNGTTRRSTSARPILLDECRVSLDARRALRDPVLDRRGTAARADRARPSFGHIAASSSCSTPCSGASASANSFT